MRKILLFFFLSWCLFPSPAPALEVPPLQGYVNDYGGMISPPVRTQLEEELKAFEQSDSTQLIILTIPTLEGEPVEGFGIKVGDTWKIGQKNKDNGIIFLVAKTERKIRIEVGKGLEGRLTDLLAGRIIDLVISPRFKRGDFDGGFQAGVAALMDATRGEFKAEDSRPARSRGGQSFFTYLIFTFVILLFLSSLSRIVGGIAGLVGLPAVVNWGLLPLGFVGLIITALIGLFLGLILPSLFSGGTGVRSGRYRSGGGFFPPIGGGWSSGGFGGGGFSGGGGSFGGGGSSGSW